MDQGRSPTGRVLLVTGPQAVGKTTVSRLLAGRFERSVHLEGDVFRRFIVAGRAEMTPDASDEALRQLRLRYGMTAAAARAYADEGFTVIVDDIVAGPILVEVIELLGIEPADVIVLMPSREAVEQREAGRDTKGYGRWSINELYSVFETGTPRIGAWVDTSTLTAEATAQAILASLSPPAPGG